MDTPEQKPCCEGQLLLITQQLLTPEEAVHYLAGDNISPSTIRNMVNDGELLDSLTPAQRLLSVARLVGAAPAGRRNDATAVERIVRIQFGDREGSRVG